MNRIAKQLLAIANEISEDRRSNPEVNRELVKEQNKDSGGFWQPDDVYTTSGFPPGEESVSHHVAWIRLLNHTGEIICIFGYQYLTWYKGLRESKGFDGNPIPCPVCNKDAYEKYVKARENFHNSES